MRIEKGRDRIVLLVPSLGLAFKFPIVRIWRTIKEVSSSIWRGHWNYLRTIFRNSTRTRHSIRNYLFAGLLANWREGWFWWEDRHPFLIQTYVSVFGLLNVQRLATPYPKDRASPYEQLRELTGGAVAVDCHHFVNEENFSLENGRLRMLDYGSPEVRDVVRRHGTHILEHFDPNAGETNA